MSLLSGTNTLTQNRQTHTSFHDSHLPSLPWKPWLSRSNAFHLLQSSSLLLSQWMKERFIRNRLWFTGLSTQQLCHKLAVTNHRLSPCGGDAKCGYEKTTFKEKFANTEIKNIMLSLGSFITLVFSGIRQIILKKMFLCGTWDWLGGLLHFWDET